MNALERTYAALAGAARLGIDGLDFPFPDLGNLTGTAILGWYAWYTASKTIPTLVNQFREEMSVARAECRVDRELLRGEIVAERNQRAADNRAIIEALNELTHRMAFDPQRPPVPARRADLATHPVKRYGLAGGER